ncbi:MAG: SDR family oxidoreductase [Anaerolineae bacterium]|nr:SDR family oxidoreductase [Anaerolineae bacterium]MDW8171293.1 SDR family oxidoreductase [Anaerolineae bacterium]
MTAMLHDKVAFITGAGSGIGRATALLLAQHGARVLVTDLNVAGGRETVEQIVAADGEAYFLACDVTQPDDVARTMQALRERWGALHLAINNAGISGSFDKPIDQTDDAIFDQVMNVNVRGVWLCMKAEIPLILASGGGAIINLASVAGLIGAPRGAAYCASKHAVIGLTRAVALEYARKGLRVNAVCPSFVETPMVTAIAEQSAFMAESTRAASPMKRLGTPKEVAEAILFLCSPGASFMNGVALPVDGGLTAS